jgi:hypothetical protein
LRTASAGSARVLGVHLEGPYINPGKLGAQPNFAHTALMEEVEAYLRLAPIRVITIAPEIAGHDALIRALSERGVRMQIGHTLGSYEEGVAALAAGASSFTHLYNAMSPLHHREPGIVGAALAHAKYAELIPDLLHVHPGAIRVALRDPMPVLRHRFHCRRRHARRRIQAGQPHRDQMPGRRAPGRWHAGRQHPDHGSGTAQPGEDRPAIAKPRNACRNFRRTTSAWKNAAACNPAAWPTACAWTAPCTSPTSWSKEKPLTSKMLEEALASRDAVAAQLQQLDPQLNRSPSACAASRRTWR